MKKLQSEDFEEKSRNFSRRIMYEMVFENDTIFTNKKNDLGVIQHLSGNLSEEKCNWNCSPVEVLLKSFKEKYPIDLWLENGAFREDYLLKISSHWLKFSPPSKSSHYALAVLYVVIMVMGVGGNALVIYMFSR